MHGAFDYVLAAFGAVVLIWAILAALIPSLRGRSAAKSILDMQKKVFSARHEYRIVTPADFPEIALAYYEQMQHWLEFQGFRFLGDIENVTLSSTMRWARAFTRHMASSDSLTTAEFYDIHVRGWPRLLQMLGVLNKDFRSIEFGSEFGDGSFVSVSNTLGANTTTPPEGVYVWRYPRSTAPQQLLAFHAQAVQYLLAQKPGVSLVPHYTLADDIEANHRAQDLRIAHYQAIGYMNREELSRIAGGAMPGVVENVATEIEAIKAKEAARGAADRRW